MALACGTFLSLSVCLFTLGQNAVLQEEIAVRDDVIATLEETVSIKDEQIVAMQRSVDAMQGSIDLLEGHAQLLRELADVREEEAGLLRETLTHRDRRILLLERELDSEIRINDALTDAFDERGRLVTLQEELLSLRDGQIADQEDDLMRTYILIRRMAAALGAYEEEMRTLESDLDACARYKRPLFFFPRKQKPSSPLPGGDLFVEQGGEVIEASYAW